MFDENEITPEMREGARRELARRELARRLSAQGQQSEGMPRYQDASFLSKLPANIAAGLGQLGQNILNESHREWETVAPFIGKHIPQPNYDISQKLGLPGTTADKLVQGIVGTAPTLFTPAGELGLVGKGIEAIPKIGGFLSGALSKGIGPALVGAATSESPTEGALSGLAIGAGGQAIKEAPKLIESLRPQKHAENLLETLGKNKSLEENAKSIAKDISEKYKENKNISGENYGLVFDTNGLGNRELSIQRNEKDARIFPKEIVNTFDNKLEDLYRDFVKNPTVKNAHDLQSQFGSSIRKLQKLDNQGKLTLADKKVLGKYARAQDYLKDALQNTLGVAELEHNIPYRDLYNQANQYYLNNVVPYKETTSLSKIATGKVKNPRNISTVFKNPEENIEKVLGHLGDEFKNKILYSELGKYSEPEKIISASKKLDEKGLNTYLNPEISKQLDLLAQKIKNKNIAKTIGGGLGGAVVGHFLPIPMAKELAPIAGAFLGSPFLQKALSTFGPKRGI